MVRVGIVALGVDSKSVQLALEKGRGGSWRRNVIAGGRVTEREGKVTLVFILIKRK